MSMLARTATGIALSVEDGRTFFTHGRNMRVTGYPVRPAFRETNRSQARAALGLEECELQLLVLGGSLGAATLNTGVGSGLPSLLALARVVHVCGTKHLDEMTAVRDGLPESLRSRYTVAGSLGEHDLATAMFASDLAITRGGASILGELPAAGLPAIVVPLPAARVGQAANAAVLERHNACLVMANHHAESGELITAAENLLRDHMLRQSMAHAMASIRRLSAADDIADMVIAAAAHA
jgi:UDP-N-acetylglucosamine--N-acetylmuramyl-(pentapeptide) pyrophosphoryl-undecaprenol N-acetylglucosamine transferase